MYVGQRERELKIVTCLVKQLENGRGHMVSK